MASDSIGGALRYRRVRGIQMAFAITIAVVALRFLPATSHLAPFSLIENYAYDYYFDHRQPRDISQFIIIAIDEESLLPQHQGRFPWPRSVYARLLPRLSQAKAVGIDLLFSEPSPDDAALAAAMKEHGRVVLAAHSRALQKNAPPPYQWRGYGITNSRDVLELPADEEFVPPVPALAQTAAGIGYVDINPDTDGVYRRVRPVQKVIGEEFPHFSTELARLANGQLFIPGRPLLINYAGPKGTVTTIPFWKVLAGNYSPASFKNKIVIIGPTAAGLYDIRPAPFTKDGRVFYGVETNANIANTLLQPEALRDLTGFFPWGVYALLVGLLIGWVVWSREENVAALLAVGIFALLALPMYAVAIVLLHQVVPYGAIILAALLPLALGLYERLGATKRQITEQFGTYVSPDVLRELAQNPEVVRHGQRRTVTLLFSDIRGSTTLSESIDPDVWIAQLNEYLSEMSDAIFAYDGYLDKFMGDGIMAAWNAFGNQDDHAELATKAAVQMLERLKRLNAEWEQQKDRVPFQIGIGLHTGEAIIGNVGSDRRAQYTAIGDSVNTASRVEALTKDFKASLILSETTAEIIANRMPLVELGEAVLKGREKPLRVFKPEGYSGEVRGHVWQEEK